MKENSKTSLFIGALIATFSWFCVAGTNALVKLLHQEINAFQILLCQNFFALIIVSLICLGNKKNIAFLKSKNYGLLFVRSFSGVLAYFLMFIALHRVSVTDATLLLNTGPFFVPFLLLFLYDEPIKKVLWLGIV